MVTQNHNRSAEKLPQSVLNGEFTDSLRIRAYHELAGSIRARSAHQAKAANAMSKRGNALLRDADVIDALALTYTHLEQEAEYWDQFDVDKFVRNTIAALAWLKDPIGGDHAT
nr:hypothetical protein [Kibdelosporangium sp. MJ126-NF4]